MEFYVYKRPLSAGITNDHNWNQNAGPFDSREHANEQTPDGGVEGSKYDYEVVSFKDDEDVPQIIEAGELL